ncbi:MAG: TIGR04255 family protein [Proteobacteria bacterium]|nr:TIGR04255 family protein [Pseudomonadota bacterium]
MNISDDSIIERVGLRKIDSILIKPVTNIPDTLNIFNPHLFSIARSGLIPIDSFKISEESVLLEKKEQLSIIRTKLIKQAIDTLQADLDFDIVSRRESNFKEFFSKTLKTLNQTHFDLFMWSVTKEMIKLMESP